MTFKGALTTGEQYSITIGSDPGAPGVTAAAVTWVPNVGSTPTAPTVHAIPPGTSSVDAGIVPTGQMLMLDLKLPAGAGAKVDITVTTGPIGQKPKTIAGSETADCDWTFLVQP